MVSLDIAKRQQKEVLLGGIATLFYGASDDPYFRSLEGQAAGLSNFVSFISRQSFGASNVVDVGANIGLSTIALARVAKSVFAFEPSPVNAAFLRRNLEANHIHNVEVLECAASSREGSLRFHVAKFGAGSHVIQDSHVSRATMSSIDVKAVTLDRTELPRIDFLKIDAEGHEPDVLSGARGLLARDRPTIYTEINLWCLSAFAGYSPVAFIRKLWDAFDVGEINPDGEVLPLQDCYGFYHDLIAKRAGIADIVLRPKQGGVLPSFEELTWPSSAIAEIHKLRKMPSV